MKLAQINEENDEHQRELIAMESTKLAEEMQKNKNIGFDAWKLIEIGDAARLAGQLERAEGDYKQAQRKFKSEDDRQGEAASLKNIAYTRGDLDEAERLYRQNLAISKEIGDRQGEAKSLNNLRIVAEKRGEQDTANIFLREANEIRRELGLPVYEEE